MPLVEKLGFHECVKKLVNAFAGNLEIFGGRVLYLFHKRIHDGWDIFKQFMEISGFNLQFFVVAF
jgi:hypothetical protein